MTSTELVSVRYLVDDVSAAIEFYTKHLGFEVLTDFSPAFADVQRGNLRLLLSGPSSSAGRAMPDGATPAPGGWNRIHLIVEDIAGEVARLRDEGVAPDVVLTSPLLRARQTGEALARATGSTNEPDDRLAPGATAETLREAIAGRGEHVVVVGHQPDCGRIAAALSGGEEPRFPAAGKVIMFKMDAQGGRIDMYDEAAGRQLTMQDWLPDRG